MKLFRKVFTQLFISLFLFISSAGAAEAVKIVDSTENRDTTQIATVQANKLATYDAGYLNQIREGNIAGHIFVRLEANNNTLGAALEEVSELGTAFPGNWPAAAAGAVLVSDSANDDGSPVGTGARTVIVRGLDTNYLEASETVTMDGTTPTAATTQTFLRIHELEVVTAGSGFTNAGTIIASISGTNIIALQDGHSKSTEGRYTVSAGYILYLQDAEGSVIGTNKDATFHLFTRDTQTANSPFVLQQIWQAQTGGYTPDGKIPAIPEKYDVIIIGEGSATGNDAAASLQGWIEEE